MKRRILRIVSILLTVTLLLSCNLVAFGAYQVTDIQKTQLGTSNTYYSFDAQTKTLTISGTGATPDFSNSSASQPWYMWRSDGSISNVVVDEGITYLGNHFLYYVSAQSITLPSTLTGIGSYALSGTNGLSKISLPSSLTKIGDGAFYLSTNLEEVVIPGNVTSIGTSAFDGCYALNSVVFENMNSNVSIGSKAFFRCRSLKNVSVPKRAKLYSYSFGYRNANVGSIYSDFVMNVYRDSPAYTYAVNKIVNPDNYNIINEMNIYDGDIIDCEYFDDSYKDKMYFYFTPQVSDYYCFGSAGDVDVDCSLYDEDDNLIAQSSDISLDNLNFSVDCYLEAGKVYKYEVGCVSNMSLGKFTVEVIISHLCESIVTPPSLTEDGYTTYTCNYCGIVFRADFVKRTGIKITGRVLCMEAPDGSHPNNYPVINAVILIDGNEAEAVDENGYFSFYTPKESQVMTISSPYSVDRNIEITENDSMEMSLGDLPLMCFDYYKDGYFNAKDFAVFRKFYGNYSPDDLDMKVLDYNRDGKIDYSDFSVANKFIAFGKITQSIYE